MTKTIHCPDCLAYYPEGYNHVCPEWMKELVKRKKEKKPRPLHEEVT